MRFLHPKVIGAPLSWLYRLWCATLRIRIENCDAAEKLWKEGNPILFALWHDELFSVIQAKKPFRMFTLVSPSRDGEYLSQVLTRIGLFPIRGSSSRGGGKAMLETVHALRREKACCAITIDGPRGPRHEVKNGILFLSQHIPAYIIPVRAFAEKTKRFERAWDKFQLPLPFSTVRIVIGNAYKVTDAELTDDVLREERARLKSKLEEIV